MRELPRVLWKWRVFVIPSLRLFGRRLLKAEDVEDKDRGSRSFGADVWDKPKKDGGVACKPRFFDLLARDVVHCVPTVQKGD